MRILLFCFLLFLFGTAEAQIVTIPDANFKAKLLSIGVDANLDGEIQVSEAQTLTVLDVSSLNISDLTGIESFTNINNLDCSSNQLNSLNLSGFSNLTKLNCSYNQITNLNFASLPAPEALLSLTCDHNPLNTFDITLLTNIEELYCSYVNISGIDLSNAGHLVRLYCAGNPISTINFSNLENLDQLMIADCNFTNIDVSPLQKLTSLNCSYNQLTSLDVTSLQMLEQLYVNNNQLNSLSISGAQTLKYLYCNHNQLQNINFQNLPLLEMVYCNHNQLNALDFSENPNFSILKCNDNNLTYISMKNGINNLSSDGADWSNNPNLQFVCVDDFETEIAALQLILTNSSLQNVNYNTYCSFEPGGTFNTIRGVLTFDVDNNGCNSNDSVQSNVRVRLTDGVTQGFSFTDHLGTYNFYTQEGDFNVSPALENPSFFNLSPATIAVNFQDNNDNTSINGFCISANGVHPDLEIVISPVIPARPGFDAIYKIVYKNKGNQVMSQLNGISFVYDDNVMDFVSTSVPVSTSGSGVLSWDFSTLLPFESRSILVTMGINAPTDTNPVNINDVLTFTGVANPLANDEMVSDNTFQFNQTVIGSFDPNDISCIEGEVVAPSLIGEYLHYTIRFENTGTAQAENVVVKVEFNPADFDTSTFYLLNASHAVDTRLNGNIAEFIFENINLPAGGKGDVVFKIKSLNTLQEGDAVNQLANIYFDYNFPVETNDAETVFQLLNTPGFENDNTIKVFPNPTQDFVSITGDFNLNSVQLFDVHGRLLQTNLVNNTSFSLDISNHSSGIYFVKVISDNGMKVEKLIKR
ncbi:T9SS type A sorting domain-containing protein [Flavobacterium sedimenticola]|uniref:T9SS type A sorting domain-containing protein n=1 Tax=Flavobacterium sedimenticola TaxID=3043286 RepID=A0ABT6XU21_9FLAO|nr:T9SS type A sorting domain-containing protein [Flavobacterium sedimenticola]MDI9258528.1 T9SS type A sorting domain-containing protein [Flavobacterium sedimenticola]